MPYIKKNPKHLATFLPFWTHIEKKNLNIQIILFIFLPIIPEVTFFFPSQEQMFNELLTCDAPPLLQYLDTYLGEKEWFIGNSVSMFYILKYTSKYVMSSFMCEDKDP